VLLQYSPQFREYWRFSKEQTPPVLGGWLQSLGHAALKLRLAGAAVLTPGGGRRSYDADTWATDGREADMWAVPVPRVNKPSFSLTAPQLLYHNIMILAWSWWDRPAADWHANTCRNVTPSRFRPYENRRQNAKVQL